MDYLCIACTEVVVAVVVVVYLFTSFQGEHTYTKYTLHFKGGV